MTTFTATYRGTPGTNKTKHSVPQLMIQNCGLPAMQHCNQRHSHSFNEPIFRSPSRSRWMDAAWKTGTGGGGKLLGLRPVIGRLSCIGKLHAYMPLMHSRSVFFFWSLLSRTSDEIADRPATNLEIDQNRRPTVFSIICKRLRLRVANLQNFVAPAQPNIAIDLVTPSGDENTPTLEQP